MDGINRITHASTARHMDPAPGVAVAPGLPPNHWYLGPVALLSIKPSNRHVLWQEWESGIAWRKPAKDFTATERGHVRFNYLRQKYVWYTIENNFALGLDHMSAIGRVYQK